MSNQEKETKQCLWSSDPTDEDVYHYLCGLRAKQMKETKRVKRPDFHGVDPVCWDAVVYSPREMRIRADDYVAALERIAEAAQSVATKVSFLEFPRNSKEYSALRKLREALAAIEEE